MITELNEYEVKMEKTLSVLGSELDGIRAGRANPAILDKISVEYYGSSTPINAVATISVPEARLMVIQPWDKGLLKTIEKAIQVSDIGINPQNDGNVIRLNFPPLTEERRKQLVKQVDKKGEESKIAIRAIRREAIDKFKKMEKKSEISEDDLKVYEKQTQELHDKYINEIDNTIDKKSKEILEV